MSNYVVITPVRNEGPYLQKTIDAVCSQTLKMQHWILVDDGSTDDTGTIIDAAAKKYSWIHAVHRPDRGFRKPGGGVIEAFYEGYDLLSRLSTGSQPWDFLVKLDGDLSFDQNYFAACLAHFAANPKLGIGGGTICRREGDTLVPEVNNEPYFHVRGATKIYRRPCWEQIGGLLKAPGWDTVDELKANMLGWQTLTFADLKLWQHKDTGSADGAWRNWVKNGRANYISGYHPIFMLSKCIRRLFCKPYGIAAVGLLFGFASCYWQGVARVPDQNLIRYVRKQQMDRLLMRNSLWS
jgi:poly-beta-1,6-N-acetyl-D-glucosamine synthase